MKKSLLLVLVSCLLIMYMSGCKSKSEPVLIDHTEYRPLDANYTWNYGTYLGRDDSPDVEIYFYTISGFSQNEILGSRVTTKGLPNAYEPCLMIHNEADMAILALDASSARLVTRTDCNSNISLEECKNVEANAFGSFLCEIDEELVQKLIEDISAGNTTKEVPWSRKYPLQPGTRRFYEIQFSVVGHENLFWNSSIAVVDNKCYLTVSHYRSSTRYIACGEELSEFLLTLFLTKYGVEY